MEKAECNRGREEEKAKGEEREVKRETAMEHFQVYPWNHCANPTVWPAERLLHRWSFQNKCFIKHPQSHFKYTSQIVCVCVCEWRREGEREGGGERKIDRGGKQRYPDQARDRSQSLLYNSTSYEFNQSAISQCLRDLFS